jgi:hypothetical protein
MKNWKFIAWIPAILFFGATLFFPSLFRIENSALQSISVVIALILLVITVYFLWEFKRLHLYLALGMVFSISQHVVVSILWQPYPQISMVMLPIVVLLAIVFWGLTAFEAFKILKNWLKGKQEG